MTHKKRPSTEKMYDYKKEKQKRILKKEYWDSYDEMNTRILSKMSIE